jgi:hypothetical protein
MLVAGLVFVFRPVLTGQATLSAPAEWVAFRQMLRGILHEQV